MDKVELKLPAVVNNIVITESMIDMIDGWQTGGCGNLAFEKREHYEFVLNEKLEDCKALILYFVGIIANSSDRNKNTEEMELMSRVYWMHSDLVQFKTPPELFININARL